MRHQTHNEGHSGTVGWALLAAGVAMWDLTQKESLSHAFARTEQNPVARTLALGALAVTAAHLIGDIIPREYDPFFISVDHTPLPFES